MKVLIAGLGNMGMSHALAHHKAGADVVLVNRSPVTLPQPLEKYPLFKTFAEGLDTKPDLVVIATYSDSHADFAVAAMEQGAHVFVEKPLATTVGDAQRVVDNWWWGTSCGITRLGCA
jgi:predicted dehydrogenase